MVACNLLLSRLIRSHLYVHICVVLVLLLIVQLSDIVFRIVEKKNWNLPERARVNLTEGSKPRGRVFGICRQTL